MKRINFNDFELITFADLNGVGIQGGKEQLKELLKDFIVGQYDLILSGLNVLPTGTPDASVHVQAGFAVSRYGYPIIAPSIMSVSLTGITAGRYCNIEVQLIEVDVDPEDRYFIDANGNTSVENVNKGVELRAQARVVEGTAGAAPSVGAGWTKVAEVYWDGTSVETADIANVSQWYVDADNTGWTTDKRITIKSRKAHDHRTAAVIDHPDASIPLSKLDPELTSIVLGGSPSDGTHANGIIAGYLNELAAQFQDTDGTLAVNEIRTKSGALLIDGEFLRSFTDGIVKSTIFSPTDPVRSPTLDTRIRVGKTKGVPNPSAGDYETIDFTSGNVRPLACKWDTSSRLTGVSNGQTAPTSLTPQKVYQNSEGGEILQVWDFTGTVQYTVSYNGANTGDFDVNTTTGVITRINLATSIQVQATYVYALVRHVLIEATTLDTFVKEGDYSVTGVPLMPAYTTGRAQLYLLQVAAKTVALSAASIAADLRIFSHKLNIMQNSDVGRQYIIDGGLQVIQRQRFTRVYEDVPWTRSGTTMTITIPKHHRLEAMEDFSTGWQRAITLFRHSDPLVFSGTETYYYSRGYLLVTKADSSTMTCTCDDLGATSGTMSFAFGYFNVGTKDTFGTAPWSKTAGLVTLLFDVRGTTLTTVGDWINVIGSSDTINLPNGLYQITKLYSGSAEFICSVGGDATGTCTTLDVGQLATDNGCGSVWQVRSNMAHERVVPDDINVPSVIGCRRSWRFAWYNGGWSTVLGRHANSLNDTYVYQFIEPQVVQRMLGNKVSIGLWAKCDIPNGIAPNTLRVDIVGAGNKLVGTKLTGNTYITFTNPHHNSGAASAVRIAASDNLVDLPLGEYIASIVDVESFTVETGITAIADENIEATVIFLQDIDPQYYIQDKTAYMGIAEAPDHSITLKHDTIGTAWTKCTVAGVTVPVIEACKHGMYVRFTIPKDCALGTKDVWLAAFQMNDGDTVMELPAYSYEYELARVNRFVVVMYGAAYLMLAIGYINLSGYGGFIIKYPQTMWQPATYAVFYGSAVVNNAGSGGTVIVQGTIYGYGNYNAYFATAQQITGAGQAALLRTLSEGENGSPEESSMLDVRCFPRVM